MGILDVLLGGGQGQKEYKDFVDRYERGNPSEGYSDKEVLQRYGEVSHAVPPTSTLRQRRRRWPSCRRKSGRRSWRCCRSERRRAA